MDSSEVKCPVCGHKVRRAGKPRLLKSGQMAYRFRCADESCNRGVTVRTGEYTPPKSGTRSLSDEQVVRILLSPNLDTGQLAKELGCHRNVVCEIRRGRTYRSVRPDIERVAAEKTERDSCHPCVHWEGHCTLGFPEGKHGNYGNLCSLFTAHETNRGCRDLAFSGSSRKCG